MGVGLLNLINQLIKHSAYNTFSLAGGNIIIIALRA